MLLVLRCSCGWTKTQEGNDAKGGATLEILKGIHEMTFKDHKIALRMNDTAKSQKILVGMQSLYNDDDTKPQYGS
jgi:hypothetical protein